MGRQQGRGMSALSLWIILKDRTQVVFSGNTERWEWYPLRLPWASHAPGPALISFSVIGNVVSWSLLMWCFSSLVEGDPLKAGGPRFGSDSVISWIGNSRQLTEPLFLHHYEHPREDWMGARRPLSTVGTYYHLIFVEGIVHYEYWLLWGHTPWRRSKVPIRGLR